MTGYVDIDFYKISSLYFVLCTRKRTAVVV